MCRVEKEEAVKKKFSEYDASEAIEIVRAFEGERLKAYQCSAGVWTIGVGHTKGVKEGDRITLEQSDELLKSDLEGFKKEMIPLVDVEVTRGQFVALLSFVFNLGTKEFVNSTLRKKLNKGDFEGASFEFLKWKFVNGEEVRGLLNRRTVERELFNYE